MNHEETKTSESSYTPIFEDEWSKPREHVRENWLTGRATHPSLPEPFLKFNDGWDCMFYWDTYFQNRGLLRDGHGEMAKNHVENLLHEVRTNGYVPNATPEWGRGRSQTPYLSMMVRDIYEQVEAADATWLADAYEALRTEYRFWTDSDVIEDHSTGVGGLQRFSNHLTHEGLLSQYEILQGRLSLPADASEDEKAAVANRLITEAETMDYTPRFERRCPDFVAVDLNSNLYRYEQNFAWMVETLGLDDEPDWNARAKRRKERVHEHLWSDDRGLFMDCDYVNDRFSEVAAVSTVYPLYVGLATDRQAARVIDNLSLFEHEWGLAVTDRNPYDTVFQWGIDDGWPPMTVLAMDGLRNYGYEDVARRVAAKYLDVATKNFLEPDPATYQENGDTRTRSSGHLYEKYDVTDGTISDDEYVANVFMGWSGAAYAYAYDYVNAS